MRKALIVAVIVLTTALAAAQKAVPGVNAPLPTQTVTTTFEAVSLPGGRQTFAATIVDAGVSFTPSTTASFETIQAPGVTSTYNAAFSYQINYLSYLINEATAGNGYKFRFTYTASLGEALVAGRSHVDGTARLKAEYAIGGGMWNFGAEVGVIRIPDITRGFQLLYAGGTAFRF